VHAGLAEYVSIPQLESNEGIYSTPWGYRFYPGKIEGEGFFIALLRKTQTQEPLRERAKNASRKAEPAIAEMLNNPEHFSLIETHLGTSLIPEAHLEASAILLKHLHLLKIGLRTGEWKGKRFVPDHELALSVDLDSAIPHLDLKREEALRYLKKESLANPSKIEGTVHLRFEGLGLGWGNALPNRINNGLPKSWRILKDIAD